MFPRGGGCGRGMRLPRAAQSKVSKRLPKRRWLFGAAVAPGGIVISLGVLVVIWRLAGDGYGLLTNLLSAALFLFIGLVVAELPAYRSPHRFMRRAFKFPQAPVRGGYSGRPTDFQIVLPTFRSRVAPPVQDRRSDSMGDTAEPNEPVESWFFNPTLEEHGINAKITVDKVVGGNDSQAAALLSSAISSVTFGHYHPRIRTDSARLYDAPSVVIGLYSNFWTQKYWDGRRGDHGIIKPIEGEVGFWVARGAGRYERFIPLDRDGQEVDIWSLGEKEDIDVDYAILARIKGHPTADWSWLLCAGIGSRGTVAAADWLAEHGGRNLRRIIASNAESPEFVVVLKVTALGNVTEEYCYPSRHRRVTCRRLVSTPNRRVTDGETIDDRLRVEHRASPLEHRRDQARRDIG